MQGSGRWLVAGATAWAVVAILGSGPAPDADTWLGATGVDTVFHLTILAVWVTACLIVALLMRRGRGTRQFKPPPPRKLWPTFAVGFVVLVIALWRPDLLRRLVDRLRAGVVGSHQDEPVLPGTAGEPPSRPDPEPIPDTSGDVVDLLGLGAIMLLAVLAVWAFSRRSGHAPSTEAAITLPVADQLQQVTQAAVRGLRSAGDPRDAVLASYAELEDFFELHGVARRVAETPSEHLGRASNALHVDPQALRRLCALYERARFSDHPITADDVDLAAHEMEAAVSTVVSPSAL